jgi:hypothetical protein
LSNAPTSKPPPPPPPLPLAWRGTDPPGDLGADLRPLDEMLSLQHGADAQHQAQQTAALDGAGGGGVDWLGFAGRVDLKAHVKHCGSVPPDVRDYLALIEPLRTRRQGNGSRY